MVVALKIMKVLILVSLFVAGTSIPLEDFYSFGVVEGDVALEKGLSLTYYNYGYQYASVKLSLSNITIVGKSRQTIFVSFCAFIHVDLASYPG